MTTESKNIKEDLFKVRTKYELLRQRTWVWLEDTFIMGAEIKSLKLIIEEYKKAHEKSIEDIQLLNEEKMQLLIKIKHLERELHNSTKVKQVRKKN